MHFEILDTEASYRRLLAAPDAASRADIFERELVAPFMGLVQRFGGDGPSAFAQWGMHAEQFAAPSRWTQVIETLAEHQAWQRAAQSLATGWQRFAPYADRINLQRITFGLVLADISAMPLQHGYSGFGGVPGWIMTIYDRPDRQNLARVESCTVHELHHNIRFTLFPFNPMTATLGEYMVAEGLAEAFAAEIYGEELLGPWVAEFDASRLDEARSIIGPALAETGFERLRGYLFGDAIAAHMGLPQQGTPAFTGYALGYRLVREYLRRSGKSVAQASFEPAAAIIAGSQFFA